MIHERAVSLKWWGFRHSWKAEVFVKEVKTTSEGKKNTVATVSCGFRERFLLGTIFKDKSFLKLMVGVTGWIQNWGQDEENVMGEIREWGWDKWAQYIGNYWSWVRAYFGFVILWFPFKNNLFENLYNVDLKKKKRKPLSQVPPYMRKSQFEVSRW